MRSAHRGSVSGSRLEKKEMNQICKSAKNVKRSPARYNASGSKPPVSSLIQSLYIITNFINKQLVLADLHMIDQDGVLSNGEKLWVFILVQFINREFLHAIDTEG